MNKLIAIGLACCLPTGLAAEDPAEAEAAVGTVSVLVIEESSPIARDVVCARSASDKAGTDCMAVHRAVLTARVQKVSARERGRWM
ncbi:MAG: hypothetical protein M3R58_05775 [Pseudomonadota bacterium]|nr:hypothetical protein [Pseudomonadota bacterium]